MASRRDTVLRRLRDSVRDKTIDVESQGLARSEVAEDVCRIFAPLFAVLVRLLLIIWSFVLVLFLVWDTGESLYWLLLIPILLTVAEGVYTIKTRGGQERKW